MSDRQSCIKRLYRIPFDYAEQKTLEQADIILVNSQFTQKVFMKTFPSSSLKMRVLYPRINLKDYEINQKENFINRNQKIILSLNRFDRKKNIKQAIDAFHLIDGPAKEYRLIIAGGYDKRIRENEICLQELISTCEKLQLTYSINPSNQSVQQDKTVRQDVTFLFNITRELRNSLLHSSHVLLYTPIEEHFGIVPLEAMACELPVIANNSGGPIETIRNQVTGYLVSDTREMAQKISLVNREMGIAGKERVERYFSTLTLGSEFEEIVLNGNSEKFNEKRLIG